MKVVVPVKRDQLSDLAFSGMADSPYPTWAAGTAYAAEDRVKVGENEYEAVVANTGKNPESSPDEWVYLGKINPLKAFDGRIYDQVIGANLVDNIVYQFTAPISISAIAFLNLTGSRKVLVETFVDDTMSTLIKHEERVLVDDAQILSWSDYFFEPPVVRSEVVIDGLEAYSGTYVRITVVNSEVVVPAVGQIVVGQARRLGVTCEGTQVSLQDYSRKERDEWGNPVIVERPFAQRVDYVVAAPTQEVRTIQRVLASIRAEPAVYYDGDLEFDRYGTTVYGYYKDFGVNLQVGDTSHMSLEVEGLV